MWIVKLGPDALLPVTLLTFSGEATGKQNLLYWTTGTEQNNKGFEVERSSDGQSFGKIAFIKSAATNGNSNSKTTYEYADAAYAAGANFYRLKQIDINGKFSYSNIIVLRNDNILSPGISIYPNPVEHILNVKITSLRNSKLTLLITDLSGRLLQTTNTSVGVGEHIIPLNVSQHPAGTYLIKTLQDDGKVNKVMKFVKQEQ